MSIVLRYYIAAISFILMSWECKHVPNSKSVSVNKDTLFIKDSLIKDSDSLLIPDRPINAELIGWDSTINLALTATFSQEELVNMYKHKEGTVNVFCYFDRSGKVIKAFIDYCKCSKVIQSKFKILLQNIEKYVYFKVHDYYIDQLKKGQSFYTGFLVVNLRLFSVDEIATVNNEVNNVMESYIDSTRKCK